ncbi:hypothetical protein JTB14_031511 [Gonioctena quinquepunctata]|nr:hypothetical protein JTB14_031511 [Gonioctena quinquepunctata]
MQIRETLHRRRNIIFLPRTMALLVDYFEQFPDGDKTVVGERGVSLSGGQRARINLARAIYRKANIYIMDDPLSAVDTHVGRHLFDECIYKHLEKKTRILVTHQLQYLKKADLIIVINEGQVEAQGSFEELSNSELDFTKMLVDEEESKNPEDVGRLHRQRSLSIHSTTKSVISEVIDQSQLSINDEDMISDPKATPFKEYMKATQSMCLLVLLIIVLILAQAACAGADYWVAFWTNQEEIRHTSLTNSEPKIMFLTEKSYLEKYFQSHAYTYRANHDKGMTLNDTAGIFDYIEGDGTVHKLLKTNYSMYFYGSLIVLAIILTLFRAILYFKLCMMSSINLHSQMFHALLKAPMRFFDINPSGRILNRFSKDMGAIDETLPRTLLDAVQIVMVMAGILVNIAASNPYMIIAMVLFGVFFIKIREWFILTAKLIKHCESATKSPVFSHVNATLNGISTIRASRVEDIVIREFDDHQDTHTSASYLTIVCSSFFGLWLDIVCVVFTACVVFSFVLIYSVSSVSGSLVGLAISQCLILTGMLQYGMRQTAEVIQHLISIERVLQYTKLDTEGPFETPENSLPPKSWPSDGQVEFKDLSLTYISDDPPVLRSLNFTVLAGEKIGIVGRTGAGKSSLISALFRLAPTEGSILIDGLDTKTIGLIDLRKNISIIPQEPVLFSASLRYNLDPFNEFEDDKLWDALEEVELKDVISSLDFMVTEGGNNFSLGQKQLICLARAILRNNRILVLDEATANVDQRTDSFIQATIRRKFKDCTVLTIAHRLNTIMDSDKVLVMSFGHILEYDHPHELLQIPDGHFYKMLLETGPVITSKLKDIARDAYEEKQSLLKEKVRKNE